MQIQYTSGTTGFPKGALQHHRGIVNASSFVAARSGLRNGAVWVNAHHGTEDFINLVSSYTRIDPKLAAKMVVPTAELGVTLGPIKELMALMREHGLLKSDVDVQAKIFNVPA